MKKNLLIVLTVVLIFVLGVPAFAALTGLTDAQKTKIQGLERQSIELRKQIIDEYAKAGQLTSDEAKVIKENMDKGQKYREENGIIGGPGMGRGRGRCGGGGCGVNGGFGGGCGMGAGFNNNGAANTQNTGI